MTKTSLKKFNIIDVIVLLFIVLAAVMLIGRNFMKNVEESNTGAEIEYTVKVMGVRQPTVDGLMNGGKVVNGKTGDPLGEIYELSTAPYTEEQNLLDGTIAVLEVAERINAYVTVRCEGVVNDDGYFIGNNQLCVGDTISLVSQYVDTNGVIVSVKEK